MPISDTFFELMENFWNCKERLDAFMVAGDISKYKFSTYPSEDIYDSTSLISPRFTLKQNIR